MTSAQEKPNPYNHSKVYKLVDTMNQYFYIGSTCNLLCKRLYKHKQDSKKLPELKSYKYFKSVNWEYVEIILIQEFNLENKDQLRREEVKVMQKYLNSPLCPNSNRAFRTKVE